MERGTGESRASGTAFDDFFLEQFHPVVLYLTHAGASPEDAKDIAQEAMLELYRRWDDILAPKQWVRVVALRALFRYIDKRRSTYLSHEALQDFAQPGPTAAEDFEARSWAQHLLEHLPPNQRDVMEATIAGIKPPELAEALGRSPASIRKTLQRARETLRRLLDQEQNEAGQGHTARA